MSEVDAVELDSAIVSKRLKEDPRFSLSAVDITNFEFNRLYDCTVYGAVHHHIFAWYGYQKASELWMRIVEHTDHLIFFETGQLPEGQRWYWQRALSRYYVGDEGHFADLLLMVGPRLKNIRIVGYHWIHGTRRWLLRIELYPKSVMNRAMQFDKASDALVKVTQKWERVIGSRQQELVKAGTRAGKMVHEGVEYYEGFVGDSLDTKVFCKKYISDEKMRYELSIASQIKSEYFIRPTIYSERYGIISPFCDMRKLDQIERKSVSDPSLLRDHLEALFEYTEKTYINVNILGGKTGPLINFIDLNSSNLFYDNKTDLLRVCDVELYSLSNRSRNQWNLAKLLIRFGPYDRRSLALWVRGALIYCTGVVVNCWKSPVERILERSSCMTVWLYIKLRERIDQELGRLRS